MELHRSIQRPRRYATYSLLVQFAACAFSITFGGCNEDTTMTSKNHPQQHKRFVVLVADAIEVDAATAILHNPAILPDDTIWQPDNPSTFATHCVLVTSDSSLAASIRVVFPAVDWENMTDLERQLILQMMPPISLSVPTRLELVKITKTGKVESTRIVTVDMLTCVATEAQQGAQADTDKPGD